MPRLTEPMIVSCVLVTGFGIERGENIVRFIGWETMYGLAGEVEERRIVMRFVMPIREAFAFHESLSAMMAGAAEIRGTG